MSFSFGRAFVYSEEGRDSFGLSECCGDCCRPLISSPILCCRPRTPLTTWDMMSVFVTDSASLPFLSSSREISCTSFLSSFLKEEGSSHIPLTHFPVFFRAVQNVALLLLMPSGSFEKKLFSLYLSYLPKEKFKYSLKMNSDTRGSFTELVHTLDCGQVSINISKPGITRGRHWMSARW